MQRCSAINTKIEFDLFVVLPNVPPPPFVILRWFRFPRIVAIPPSSLSCSEPSSRSSITPQIAFSQKDYKHNKYFRIRDAFIDRLMEHLAHHSLAATTGPLYGTDPDKKIISILIGFDPPHPKSLMS